MKGFIEFEESNLKTAISVGAIKRIVEHKDSVEIVTDDYSYFTGRETYSEIRAKIEEAQREDVRREKAQRIKFEPYTGTCEKCIYWHRGKARCLANSKVTSYADDGCIFGEWRDYE